MEAGSAGAPGGTVKETIKWKTKETGAAASVPFPIFRNFGRGESGEKVFSPPLHGNARKTGGGDPGVRGTFRRKSAAEDLALPLYQGDGFPGPLPMGGGLPPVPLAKGWRFPAFARKELAGRVRRKKRPLLREGTLFGTVFVYLGRRTMSGVISARE